MLKWLVLPNWRLMAAGGKQKEFTVIIHVFLRYSRYETLNSLFCVWLLFESHIYCFHPTIKKQVLNHKIKHIILLCTIFYAYVLNSQMYCRTFWSLCYTVDWSWKMNELIRTRHECPWCLNTWIIFEWDIPLPSERCCSDPTCGSAKDKAQIKWKLLKFSVENLRKKHTLKKHP